MLHDCHVISDVMSEFEKNGIDMQYGDSVFVDKNNIMKVKRKWIGGIFVGKSDLDDPAVSYVLHKN